MKVFVTTGTTPFEPLVLEAIELSNYFEVIIQTPEDTKEHKNAQVFKFIDDIERYYDWADVVVTHAGAGSVYKLLEREKKVVVVPNLTRKDPHQKQLAQYVDMSGFGEVCYDVNNLKDSLQMSVKNKHKKYQSQKFSDIENILTLFGIETND